MHASGSALLQATADSPRCVILEESPRHACRRLYRDGPLVLGERCNTSGLPPPASAPVPSLLPYQTASRPNC
jgi:hypothetical protein